MAEYLLDEALVSELGTKAAQLEVYDKSFSAGGSFGVRLSKTGRKAFFVIYSLHGKRKRMTLGSYPLVSLSEARNKALAVTRKALAGQDAAAEWRLYRRSETFADLVRLYKHAYLAARCGKKTQREYDRILQKELLPLFADRKLQDISAREITELITHIATARNSPVLAARVRAVISSAFAFAAERGLCRENPARETKAPAAVESRRRVLTIEELHQLFQALAAEPPELEALFKVLILTGQRIGDVLSLRWSDLRVDTWCVPPRQAGEKPVPIHLVAPVLHALRQLRTETGGSDTVFPAKRGAGQRSLSRAVERLNQRMQASPAWNALDLYRTFHFGLMRLGVRPDTVDIIQQRRSVSGRARLPAAEVAYDYSQDIQQALHTWAKAVLPSSPGTPSRKVLTLLPRQAH